MAFKLPSGVLETTTTSGTGPHTLAGAVDDEHLAFADELSNGDTTFAFMTGGSDWQEGEVTYSGGQITWTTIYRSSNGDAAVDWPSGTKRVGVGLPGPEILDGAAIAKLHAALGIAPRKNLLPNGGFQVAQRGAGPFTSASSPVNGDDTYLLDGCIFLADGSDTCDVSQVADTDFVSGYKIRLDVETANRRFGILLPIESRDIQAIRKSGKASIQFKVKRTGSTLTNVRAYLLSWSSTADAITSDVISAWGSADGDPTLVANWTAENTGANLAVGTTVATHRIEGIAVDTASVTNLALLIISNPTTTTAGDFLDIGDIQLEEGVKATEYEHRPIAEDLAWCSRYFERLTAAAANHVFGSGVMQSTTNLQAFVPYAEKRTAPTLTYSTASNFRGKTTGDFAASALATTTANSRRALVSATVGATTAGYGALLAAVNSSALVDISAEL